MSDYADLPLFAQSSELKDAGMQLAAVGRQSELAQAKAIAIDIASSRSDRCCHMDLVRERIGDLELGPAAGSVFKDECWEFTGTRIRSCLPANHARELKVWRLK